MDAGARTCWRAIVAQPTASDGCTAVSRARWLAALYRLQNGEPLGSLRLVDPSRAVVVTDPADVDWASFPVLEALEAVARDELRLLRNLLDETPLPTQVAPLREEGLTLPGELVWGIDLRGATSSEL